MRIAVLPRAFHTLDGGSHYERVFLNALAEIAARSAEDFVCVAPPETTLGSLSGLTGLNFGGIPIRAPKAPMPPQSPPETYLRQPPSTGEPIDPDSFVPDTETARAFREAGYGLLLQLGPFAHVFAAMLPFIMTIYDLNHRLQPEFLEVSAFGEFNRREYLYRNACRYATFVLVDSEAGKEDVLRFYGDLIGEDRIRVLPYYPAIEGKMPDAQECARIAAKYHLPPRFFFYPAQFWRHKNHDLILKALKRIADTSGEKIPIVFCGVYADFLRAQNFNEIRATVQRLGLGEQAFYLGAVPDEDMPALYSLCAGLVMPTFFGPTNLPPLEAWHYGRPVITSNIRGICEQMGDAALLVNPRAPEELADAMLRLWRDEALAADLVVKGHARLSTYRWSSFVDGIAAIIAEAAARVRGGTTPRFPDGTPA